MTSSHNAGVSRRNRDGSAATKKQQPSKSKRSSKDKTRHDTNTCGQQKSHLDHECECIAPKNRKVPHRRMSVCQVPHEYTPFHDLSLDVMDGLPDCNEQEFGKEPDHERYDNIGDESTTFLTPSYDTTSSTIPTYFDESDDQYSFNSMPQYSRTTHDLQYIGHWTETQGDGNESWDVLPSYVNAMTIGRRFSRRAHVREAVVVIERVFPSVGRTEMPTYNLVRR